MYSDIANDRQCYIFRRFPKKSNRKFGVYNKLRIFAKGLVRYLVMAKIDYSLSSKIQKESGKSEIMIRFSQSSVFNLRAKSGIFITPEHFEYYIDFKKANELGITIPGNRETATKELAQKKNLPLKLFGKIVIRERVNTPDVVYHKNQNLKLQSLTKTIIEEFEKSDINDVKGEWLKKLVDKFNHPEKYQDGKLGKNAKSVFDLLELYLEKKEFSNSREKTFRVLERDIARYQMFINQTRDKQFVFNPATITKDDLDDFRAYLKDEWELSNEYPQLFQRILSAHPLSIGRGKRNLQERGDNAIIALLRALRAFFRWLFEEGWIKNKPFDSLKIGQEKYGTPYYISIDERNKIASLDMSNHPLLSIQRDIFVFHCYVGCRVSDLMQFTKANIIKENIDGVETYILVYTPHKTENVGEQTTMARIPLHPYAVKLIKKYDGVDKKGRLFPFISSVKYNKDIKKIFTLAGITRNVTIRNSITGEPELKPINEIASSHLARRTFIGNAYLYTPDPNIISKMSGHVEGSKSFARYRKIEDSTLNEVIKHLG